MNTVVVRSIDRDKIRLAMEAYAGRLRVMYPEVERVIWFGSWVNGLPHPGSDVDVCLVLSASEKKQHERVADYLPAGFPVGVDLLVFTREEFRTLEQRAPGLYRAITAGIDLS